MSEWERVRLGEVVALDIEAVLITTVAMYSIVGVLNRGRGLLFREPIAGDQTAYKTLNRIRPDQIVYSRLKAFEGAITVAPNDLSEAYASQEFPTFTCGERILPEYFRLITTTKRLWDQLQMLSIGMGGRRERVKPADFLTIEVALPSPSEQRRIVDIIATVDAQIEALADEGERAWRLHAATRDDMLSMCPRIPLSAVCDVRTGLVDPRLDEYSSLVHVGVDSMEKNTGRIVGARTAREDGLVSGKYLFESGDVIYSKIRPALRKVSAPDFRGLCSADAYPLRPNDDISASLLRETLLFEPVVEEVVKMSGRTKMPKVNRKELFSVCVPLPDVEARANIDSTLLALRNEAEVIGDELAHLRTFRFALVTSLLNQEVEIPESYGTILEGVS